MHKENIPVFLTIKAAALKAGLPYRVLLEAVNNGEVPYYRLGKSRRLLRLEEIVVSMRGFNKEAA